MSRQSELAKNTLILTFGKICTQFVSFLLLPLYTVLLSPEAYGVVDLISTYVLLLLPLVNWQFESGLFRFMLDCRKDAQKQKELFSTVLITNFIQAGAYLFLFYLLRDFIHIEHKLFLALGLVSNVFLNTMLQFARGLGNNTVYAVGSFISASSAVALNVILIAGLRLGALGMLWSSVISRVVTIAYLVISLRTWRYFSVRGFRKSIFKEVFGYSLPLVPNQLSWWVVGVSDRMVITYAISVAANGIYSVANKFSSVFSTFFSIFNLSWTESVSLHLKDSDSEKFLTETFNSVFALFAAAGLGIIACMPFAFPILVPNIEYSDAYGQIPILIIGILFQVVMGLLSAVYLALKKSKEVAKSTFYSAVINLVVNIALIRFIGLYAASVSTLASFAFVAVYRYFDVQKYAKVRFRPKLLALTCVVGALTLVSYYYNHLITNILTLAVVVVYAVAVNKPMLLSVLNTVRGRLKGHK